MPHLNGWFYRFPENYLYALPEPPPRKRTKSMEVLCVGMPRSGTESLQRALLKLGYDHTYHGWDIIYEEAQQWTRLCRKKWFGSMDGNTKITAAEFDAVMGHCVAVTDAAASVFAAELIEAYPDTKVVLNYRKDLNAQWAIYLLSRLDKACFWSWPVYVRFMWPGLFRALDGDILTGIARNGKWAYRDHCNMVRGMVPKDRLLEWSVEDGWEPLCTFLGNPIPDEPYTHVNAASGWEGHGARVAKKYIFGALWNLGLIVGVMVGAGTAIYKHRVWIELLCTQMTMAAEKH